MGMSADYETAVMIGATHVRVGTACSARARPVMAEVQLDRFACGLIFDFDGVLIESE